MAIHVERSLLFAGLLLVLLCVGAEARPKEPRPDGDGGDGDDDDDSSSEETVEDSDEGRRRRRRREGERAAIPGLPDPATIIKFAQLFQSVGEQIVPLLLEAVLPMSDPAGDRAVREVPLLQSLKRTLKTYSDERQLHPM